jgi:elongation factor Ts
MSTNNTLEKVKKLRELTGVGFKDCKNAIDENDGDIEKSIEFLRKKGIAKAGKKMERVAADGLVCVSNKDNEFSIIEVNSETDFVAKNDEFIKFVEELSAVALSTLSTIDDLSKATMKNKRTVKENIINLITKIGEKITLRKSDFLKSDSNLNFSYVHSEVKKNIGKIGVLISVKSSKPRNELEQLGKQLSMHIAALSPLSIDKETLDKTVIEKEREIIVEELKNSGKDSKIIDKIAIGKLNKFINDNTLLNQEWIMEPKKKVKDVLKEVAGSDKIEVIKFIRFKVGEGV